MTRKEIIMVMGTADISNRTLLHKLNQYVDVCMVEVDEMIRCGIEGPLEKFVAWILRLKKYIPTGWHPTKIIRAQKQQQLSLPLPHTDYKGVMYDKATGTWKARLYSNGKSYHIGRFPTARKAAVAWNKLAKVLGRALNVIENE